MTPYIRRLILGIRFKLGLVWRPEAYILARRGRFHDAQWRYARATGLNPDSDESWSGLAAYLGAKSGPTLGLAALEAGMGRGAGKQAQYDLIVGLATADRAAEAIAQAATFSDPEACLRAATTMAQRGHHAVAERFARLSATIDPTKAEAWLQLGNAQAKLERYQEAIESLEESVVLEPGNNTRRATLGQVYAHIGRNDEARQVFRAILRQDPANPHAWSSLAHLASQTLNTRNPAEVARAISDELAGDQSMQPSSGLAPTASRHAASKSRLRLAPRLLPLLPPGERIVILDGGARDAHADPRWRDLPPNRLEFHGFEPDPPECDRLNAALHELGYAGAYYPIGLGMTDGMQPFHVNKASGGSSFLDQNIRLTDRWRFENPHAVSLAREIFRPEKTVDMPVATIAQWGAKARIPAFDFCKLNVQGAELDILAAAGSYLDRTLGVLSEVAFVESYVGRSFFSDIDVFLRRAGFAFFDFLAHHYIGRADAPVVVQHLPGAGGRLGQLFSTWGQLVEAHGLYLRDPIALEQAGKPMPFDTNSLIKLIIIAEVFGQVEYAFELGGWLAQRADTVPDLTTKLRRAIDDATVDYLSQSSPASHAAGT